MNKILLLDNYDSFTYNLSHLVQKMYSGEVVVLRDKDINYKELDSFEAIIISPGPGRPKTTPAAMDIIDKLHKTKPILGICLGMQCLNEYFNGETIKATNPIHGKVYKLTHSCNQMFKNVPQNSNIARYHSLTIKPSKDLIITGYVDDKTIMAIKHKTLPLYGLQFHPESFLTSCGDIMIRNFFNMAGIS